MIQTHQQPLPHRGRRLLGREGARAALHAQRGQARGDQEVLLHASVYCGVPTAVEAFRSAAEVVEGAA